ncbi:hypothetical protein GQ44DRAFT_629129 [Phaeosphaeriaceae sp. PMI808]|nr:hypothetical protein GQ44DRAFT_629129 [Phaeosphaeriaceae sp. PMI808]
MDVGLHPPFHEGHAAPLIQILAWLFLTFSILTVVAQLATKKAMAKRLVGGDYVLLVALFLAIGQAVALLSPPGQAIGNTQVGMSEETISGAWETLYKAEILGVLSQTAAKGSLLVFLTSATPFARHRWMMHATSAITVFWGFCAVFLIAFQCPAPHRSDVTNPQCMDIRAVRTFIALLNIVTDFALVIVPTLMFLPLQLELKKRLTLMIGFWFRIIVVFAALAQVGYIYALPSHGDLLNAIWRAVVAGQVVQVATIVTTTVPFLKPFMMSIDTSLLGGNRADVRSI